MHTRRIGKPRANWLIETYNDAWSRIDAENPLDINDWAHLNILAARALAGETPFSYRNSLIAYLASKLWRIVIEFVTEYFHRILYRFWARHLFPNGVSRFDIWTADSIGTGARSFAVAYLVSIILRKQSDGRIFLPVGSQSICWATLSSSTSSVVNEWKWNLYNCTMILNT